MFPEDLNPSDIPLHLAFATSRKILADIWERADDTKTVTVVSLDLDMSQLDRRGPIYITELGLSTQPWGRCEKRVTRHFLVDSNQDKKTKSGFTPPGFGVKSEHIGQQEDLYMLLAEAVKDHTPRKHEVVLTGFAMHSDLSILYRSIGWLPPPSMYVIDAQHIWASFLLPPNPRAKLPNLKGALADFDIPIHPSADFHNPANDAWYTMELYFRRAEQAKGPVTIKAPPCNGRGQPGAAPTAAPAPAIPHWAPAICKPSTQNGNRRRIWSSNLVSQIPNLSPLSPTRDRMSNKRKWTEGDEKVNGCRNRPRRASSGDGLRAAGCAAETMEPEGGAGGTGGGKCEPEVPGILPDLAAEDVSVSATLERERVYGDS